jgi:D-alanine--poly(phosphoribitol) ligase subunit 1
MTFYPLDRLTENFRKFPERNAFFIEDHYYTYAQFEAAVAGIQQMIGEEIPETEQYIGLLTYDNLQTYAAIYALWYSGKAYIPLNPANPADRNHGIVGQTKIRFMINPGSTGKGRIYGDSGCSILETGTLSQSQTGVKGLPVSEASDCYVLFTSGSTGTPKGVPISRKNLGSFVDAFIHAGYQLSEEDRFLQIYDLSFDASVHCFTVPLSLGACVYTVPGDKIKYLYAYRLMAEKELTFVKMPPSTLAYLQPYFGSVRLPALRYCLLGGEAFSSVLAENWEVCIPNAQIQNVYGPTEATINSHIYNWDRGNGRLKSNNGIVSIGRCFGDNRAIVVDEQLHPLADNEKGELCLSGSQLTRGYWKDDEKTAAAFFMLESEGGSVRYYRTGDLVYRDEAGDFMYIGRLDSQVQIQGYRVEMGEIEKHARDHLQGTNVAALARSGMQSAPEITLFTEKSPSAGKALMQYLEGQLPAYMLPRRIIDLDVFPKSAGGKIDRKALENYLTDGPA